MSEKTHRTFKSELLVGYEFQKWVATFFSLSGFDVELPELKVRPSLSQPINEFLDDFDFRVTCGKREFTFEVKSVRIAEKKIESIGYLFVDTVSGYKKMYPKPNFYISVYRESGKMVFTQGRNSHNWGQKETFDKVRGYSDIFYTCPLQFWHEIKELTEWMGALP